MYDFIIVGAGSAGCVLANRLTENPHNRVLLLEAGGAGRQLETKVPAAFYKLFKQAVDWDYKTAPQSYLQGRQLYWPRGKMLGGCSAMNAMIYIRGHRADYDHWAALGNESWGYEDVLPYFKKGQNQERGCSRYHAVGGPLNVADLRDPNPLTQVLIEAAVSLGYHHNGDFNGGCQEGFGHYQVTQRRGQRESAATAYLQPAQKRPNLTVLTHAECARILCKRQRALGVEYLHDNRLQQVTAGKEVILAAGAVNSPHLLLLSGIGPAAHLQEMGIEIQKNLPGVGQNLQDHAIVPVVYRSTEPITLDGANTVPNLLRYFILRRGPLTSNLAEGGGFIKTTNDVSLPDIQFHFGPVYFVDHGLTKMEGHGISIGPTLIHPKSRGEIRLQNSYPFLPPTIQPNYYTCADDLETMLAGLKLAQQLLESAPFTPYRGAQLLPDPAMETDDAYRNYIRERTETLYHPVGSCKMGHDKMAVVNDRLQVHGMQGLRIVDGSIMPTIVGGNTNAPIMMIAEKAADFIKAAWQ